MAFDAGTIVARLDLEDSEFYRKLKAASTAGDAAAKTRTAKIEPEVPPGDVAAADAKLDEVAHEREVKITPRVDESAFGRIRDSYRRLDEQLTNDVRRRGGVLAGMLGGSGMLRGAAGIPGMIGGLFGGGGGGGAAGAAPGAAGQTADHAGDARCPAQHAAAAEHAGQDTAAAAHVVGELLVQAAVGVADTAERRLVHPRGDLHLALVGYLVQLGVSGGDVAGRDFRLDLGGACLGRSVTGRGGSLELTVELAVLQVEASDDGACVKGHHSPPRCRCASSSARIAPRSITSAPAAAVRCCGPPALAAGNSPSSGRLIVPSCSSPSR